MNDELAIRSLHRIDDGADLKFHTKHAVEVGFNRPIKNEMEEKYNAEALAAEIVMDTYVKSRPYPNHCIPDVVAGSDTVIVYWTEDDEERFIEGPDGSYYNKTKVGGIVYYENAAPGVGHARFRVDRKDETGLWGLCMEDTRWVPDGDFYR